LKSRENVVCPETAGHEALGPLCRDDVFGKALSLEAPLQLGANGRMHAATCLVAGIPAILTADVGFDDVRGLRRVDPLDERGLQGASCRLRRIGSLTLQVAAGARESESSR
jgi:hypothetical protein